MIIRRIPFENQPIVNSHFNPAIPPHFLWSAVVPELNLMTGERCTLRSDAIFSTISNTPCGSTKVIVPATTDASMLTSSVPACNSRGWACLVVSARNANNDVINVISSPSGSTITYLQWSWLNFVSVGETSYIGPSAGNVANVVSTGNHCFIFGKTQSGRYFISYNGVKTTNGFLDGNSANIGTLAGQWAFYGRQTSNNHPLISVAAIWPNVPADIISDEYGKDPWKLFGSRNAPTQLYQPADSILVPPVLSNPSVSDITTTTALPSVKVEF